MSSRRKTHVIILLFPFVLILLVVTAFTLSKMEPQEDLKGKYSYKDFESAKNAGHVIRAFTNNGHKP